MTASSWQGIYMNATTVPLPFTFTEIEDARVAVNANGSNIVYGTVASVSGTSIKYYHSSPNDVITGRSCIEVKGKWK